MDEYIAKYIVSKDHRRIGEINVRYTANNDDESIKIAKSVCGELGEEVEEVVIGKIIGAKADALVGNSLSGDDKFLGATAGALIGAFAGHIIDSSITKVIFTKKYPCIKPKPFEEIVNYLDFNRIEEIVNER